MAAPPTTIGLADNAPTPGPTSREAAPEPAPEGTPVQASTATEEPAPSAPAHTAVAAPPSESDGSSEAQGVFLKQDGKVYLVKDWATLQRWIMERRVGREDLVSDGGVRWEPIGSRAELGSFFAAVEQLEAAELAGLRGGDTPFPTEGGWGESVAEPSPASGLARLDDETEGVPMGLPPLPTEDLDPPDAGGEDYPDQPPSRLSAATPAPESAPSALDPTPSMPMFAEEDDSHADDSVADEGSDEQPEAGLPLDDGSSIDDAMPFDDGLPLDDGAALDDAMPLDDEPAADDAAAEVVDAIEGSDADASESEASDELPFSDESVEASESLEATTDTDEADDFENLFQERNVALEHQVGLRPGDSVVDFADTEVPSEIPDDPDTERPDTDDLAEPTDEFDPEDPFRDFSESIPDVADVHDDEEPIILRRGPPPWLGVGAAVVVTLLVALALLWAYQNGYLGGQPGPADTGVADQAGEVPEPTTPTVADPPPEVAAATDDTDESAATDDTDDAAIDDSDAAAAVDVPDEDPPADPVVTEPADTTPTKPADTTPTKPADTTPTKPADTTPTKPADPPPASSVSVSRLKGRGWAAIDKGQVPDAIDTFKRAVAQAPNDPEAQYGLGYSYLQANDKAQAKVHLCRAQSLSRGNVDISRQVAGELKSQGLSCP